jgi:DNA-binding NarL/FixJ family response regulator
VIRVFVADDQALVRDGLKAVLEAQADIEVVGEAANGAEAVLMCRRLRPDVVLLDIRMPHLDGIEAAREILASAPGTAVLILTTFDLDEYVYAALKAGAGGFLLKDATREQIVDAVRAVAGGETLLAPQVTRRLIEQFVSRRPPDAQRRAAVQELTERELQVLRCLAEGIGNAEIAARLGIGEATVKTHVAHILMKLDLRDRTQAVIFAYESGLV